MRCTFCFAIKSNVQSNVACFQTICEPELQAMHKIRIITDLYWCFFGCIVVISNEYFRSLVTICAVSGSSLNPFVYVFRNESVRKEATRVVCWYVVFLFSTNILQLMLIFLINYK